ncbi:MAG: right-handed parallel beta-helix repeat-containing protein [Bacteroidota bacterium]
MKKLFTTFLLCSAAILAKANTYYVSSTGNDANNGRSISEAWNTLDAVTNFPFVSGDIVLLQGGITFNGNIKKTGLNGVTFSSYGVGKATISSDMLAGIWLSDANNITIKNLIFKGAGYMTTTMWKNGIDFIMSANATGHSTNSIIDNIESYGYGGMGVSFYTESALYGFKNITVTNSLFHDNGMAGLNITGSWDDPNSLIRYSNSNVYIANCKAYYNHGRRDYKDNWSGSGILVAGTVGGLVEYCEAYENGKDNGSMVGGPIGIWMDDSKFVTIQYCVSHHNKGGPARTDGGGFDIDGGTYGSVIQHCDSYENEGTGYGLFQWTTGNKWSNDTIRNCTSFNDGRNTKYGAFTFWGASPNHKVTNAEIYGNRVTVDKAGKALSFLGNYFSNVNVHDNEFCIVSPAVLYTTLASNVTLSNNTFPCQVLSVRTGSFKVKRIS